MSSFAYLLVNLGCRLNQAELTKLENYFQENKGFYNPNQPQIVVVNTCAVTSQAEGKSRRIINQLRRRYPQAVIVAWGCAVERWLKDKTTTNIPADYFLDNKSKDKIAIVFQPIINKLLKTTVQKRKKFYLSRPRRFIKIQDGCNKFCSYCLIPYLRRRSRSKPLDEIITEIHQAEDHGVKEVILTGVDIADYHWQDLTLKELIQEILKQTKVPRLRLGSISPLAFKDKDFRQLLTHPRLMAHYHISLQSGSNKILKSMKRDYSRELFLEVSQKLKETVKNVLITTDVIVGFPGETETDFSLTVDLIKKVKFSHLHIFPFSLRQGTLVEKLDLKEVPKEIIKQRSHQLQKLNQYLENHWRDFFKGKKLEVLWESYNNGFLWGWSQNYLRACRRGRPSLVGTIETIPYQPCLK